MTAASLRPCCRHVSDLRVAAWAFLWAAGGLSRKDGLLQACMRRRIDAGSDLTLLLVARRSLLRPRHKVSPPCYLRGTSSRRRAIRCHPLHLLSLCPRPLREPQACIDCLLRHRLPPSPRARCPPCLDIPALRP